ncbi:MAG: DNA-binding protein [Tenacibaculum sp.]|nr:DNA-binding protein [Tenacibaculum sp.]
MYTLKQLERLKKLHELIAVKKTGTPCELAENFGISRRSLFMMIEELRDMRAKILYSRSNNTYYYENDFDLQINVSIQAITSGDSVSISGGSICVDSDFYRVYRNRK